MSGVELVAWEKWKTVVTAASLDFIVIPTTNFYYPAASGMVIVSCELVRDGNADTVDFENNYLALAKDFFYSEINQTRTLTGNGTTTVKTGSGLLRAVLFNNNATGGVVTIYDNTAGSGTVLIGPVQLGSPSGGLLTTSGIPGPAQYTTLDFKFSTGLTVVRSGSSNNCVTLVYR